MRGSSCRCVAICVALGLGCSPGAEVESSTGTGTDTDPTTTASAGTTSGTTDTTTSAAASDDGSMPTEGSTGSDASTSATTTTTTTTTPPTGPPDDDDGGGPAPLGPGCSVQVVTQGDEFNPLSRGDVGEFPAPVADVLEDYCGCHTLADNSENIEWKFLLPPEGTLFLSYADLSRSYQGSTLGQTMGAVTLKDMPPGSCPRPSGPLAVLTEWFEQGLPDGANYVP